MTLENLLRHIAWIIVGYIAAACVAGTLAALAFYFVIAPPTGAAAGAGFVAFLTLGIYLTALVSVLPALAIVAVCEWMRWRGWRFYAGAGALIGIFAPMFVLFGLTLAKVEWLTLLFGAIAGGAAGYVYWRLAGKNAGAWRA